MTHPDAPPPDAQPESDDRTGSTEPTEPTADPEPAPAPYDAPDRSGQDGSADPQAWPASSPAGPVPVPYPTASFAPASSGPTQRFPGWAWPVMTVLALVVGGLGGVLAAVAVSTSMGVGPAPLVSADNGAADPLRVDNRSISAVAARLLPSTVQVQANGGAGGSTQGGATGSGFVLDDEEHVITNNHVVAGATGSDQLAVVDQSGRSYPAKITGRSPVYDLAVLKIDRGSALRPAAIGSSRALRVGDTVVAIGSPLGLSSTVTSGIVSATNRPVTTGDRGQASYINALQTDAAINPGNSGGPLVNIRGQVVGVNSAIATTGGATAGATGNIGVGFAIPMEQVQITAGQILATGRARYPVIGANVDTVSGSQRGGAEVVAVPAGTPAAAAGLRKGDVVTRVDGQAVTDGISLIVAIRSHQPGETIALAVQRGGQVRSVRVTLDSKVG